MQNKKEHSYFIKCTNKESLLNLAKKQFVKIPYGCANGGCGMCKVKIIEGEYELQLCSKGALSDVERKQGFVLSCKTHLKTDLIISL